MPYNFALERVIWDLTERYSIYEKTLRSITLFIENTYEFGSVIVDANKLLFSLYHFVIKRICDCVLLFLNQDIT